MCTISSAHPLGPGVVERSHNVPCQFEIRPSVWHLGQNQMMASSGATDASTVAFLHLKQVGAMGASAFWLDARAVASVKNSAIFRAGPLSGAIAPRASRKCFRSQIYIGIDCRWNPSTRHANGPSRRCCTTSASTTPWFLTSVSTTRCKYA